MKKKILVSLLVLVIMVSIVGIYAYREFNRKVDSVSSLKADFDLQAASLIDEFAKDSKTSSGKYISKTIAITGIVANVEEQQNSITLIFKTDGNNAIRCSMDSTYTLDKVKDLNTKSVTVKGICTGYNADDLGLGSDIIINRCIIKK